MLDFLDFRVQPRGCDLRKEEEPLMQFLQSEEPICVPVSVVAKKIHASKSKVDLAIGQGQIPSIRVAGMIRVPLVWFKNLGLDRSSEDGGDAAGAE
jgi:hypothetical protein